MDKIRPRRGLITQQTNVWFMAAWFGAAVTSLIFALVFTLYLSQDRQISLVNQNFKVYASLPESGMKVSEDIQKLDARAKIIENFFKGYNAPLWEFSQIFTAVADKYSLDYRLLPAIAMQESNGGKKVIEDSKNPFGYGIYGGKVLRFDSFEEAIERVGRGLREDYLDKGLTKPEAIMAKYTPPSIALGGPWAKGVSIFMEELR